MSNMRQSGQLNVRRQAVEIPQFAEDQTWMFDSGV